MTEAIKSLIDLDARCWLSLPSPYPLIFISVDAEFAPVSCIVCMATYLEPSVNIQHKSKAQKCNTYRKVPAENNRSMPVRQRVPASSPLSPEPNVCTKRKVANAPTGAAKLKTSR